MIPEVRVLVFARAPVPGAAKTRLAGVLGPNGAASLQAWLTVHALRTARDSGLGPVELWCAPNCGHRLFRRLRRWAGFALREQHGPELGARMAGALGTALDRAPAAVLIGTDCPALHPTLLRRAAGALAEVDAVFAPAEDGGYVLVGLRRPAPELFQGIDWGTGRVWRQTLRRLRTHGLRWTALPPLPDLDRPEDLRRSLPPPISRRIAILQRNRKTARTPGWRP